MDRRKPETMHDAWADFARAVDALLAPIRESMTKALAWSDRHPNAACVGALAYLLLIVALCSGS